jgi:hypothetical protein
MPVAADLPERWQAFSELREELLVGYGYQTARAYWADLQHVAEWAEERELDVLQLTADVNTSSLMTVAPFGGLTCAARNGLGMLLIASSEAAASQARS